MGGKPRQSRLGSAEISVFSTDLDQAERSWEHSPAAALEALRALATEAVPPAVRVQALALLAISAAARGSDEGFREADALLAIAERASSRSEVAQARLAHASGYIAYRRGEHVRILPDLNRAASLYPPGDRRRAQVFDTLGLYFQYDVGDLQRARAYFELSIQLKLAAARTSGIERERRGLAITYGNLGRLELSREHHAEAERWFRHDLDVVLAGAGDERDEAHVRNQLALALIGRGPDHHEAAERELDRALEAAPTGSVTESYVQKDRARLAVERGDMAAAEERLDRARTLAEAGGFREVLLAVRFLEGRIAARRAASATEPATARALAAFDAALSGYEGLRMHRERCEVAEAKAALLDRIGQPAEAIRCLEEIAIPVAERHLFNQLEPLARIEARLAAIDPTAVLRLRSGRMLGGLTPEQHQGRLRCERRRVTVWTCDIRGFSQYCEETGDPMLVVDMLNRFFAALGRPILDGGGRIDKYVGDNILAYFADADAAAEVSLRAIELVARLNTQREHLDERTLDIGIGMATGEVVAGNVGFAGKLEHTIVGTTVNRACRLVGHAAPGETILDHATRQLVNELFECRPVPRGGGLELKGLGRVKAYRLGARR